MSETMPEPVAPDGDEPDTAAPTEPAEDPNVTPADPDTAAPAPTEAP